MPGWGTLANVMMHLAFAAGVSVMSWLGFLDSDWSEPEVEIPLLAWYCACFAVGMLAIASIGVAYWRRRRPVERAFWEH